MSNLVDQRIVEMRFDNSQFEKGVAQSIKSIDNLKQSLNFNDVLSKSDMNSIANNLSSLGSSVDNIANRFSTAGIAATTWIAKISSGLYDLANNAIQNLIKNAEAGYDRYNTMMESIQTIMYATRDEWEDTGAQMDYVTSQIDKLNWYTDETSYNLSDMTNSIGKFVAAGVSLDDATAAMQGIASWAAISGQNAEKASYAMYNLSQAMAIGKVTAADWKSIENANMATKEFKQTAYETAVELGKLERVWVDEWQDTGVFFTGKLKEGQDASEGILITSENLRTTLQYGWFDKDVLTATLKKYGDFSEELYKSINEIGVNTTEFLGYLSEYEEALKNGEDMDAWVKKLASKEGIDNVTALGTALKTLSSDYYALGKASFRAAQESKTFKDSLNYTADAITTTWMNIFQDIFGNYLESKELWTAVSELMYEQLVAPLEEIEEQFASWNRMGGADILKDSFWNFYEVFNNIITAIKEGWKEVFPNELGRQLLYIVQDIFNLSEKIQFIDWPWYSDFEVLKEAAESLARVIWRLFNNIQTIAGAIGKAWDRIFPKKETGTAISKIIENIHDFAKSLEDLSAKFILTGDDAAKLERTFAGLFAILDIGRLLLMAIIEPFLNINAEMGDVSYGILDVTASIGDWLVSLRDFIRDNEIFKKAVSWLMATFAKLPAFADKVSKMLFGMGIGDLLNNLAKNATTFFMIIGGLLFDFEGTLSKLDEFLTNSVFGNFWVNLKTNVDKAWSKIKDFFGYVSSEGDGTKGGIISFFSSTWTKIKAFFDAVKTKAAEIWDAITGKDSNIWSSIGEWISELWSATAKDSKGTWDTISGFFMVIGNKIKAVWDKLPFSEKINSIALKIKEFFAAIPEGAKDAWKNVKNFFGLIGEKGGEVWGAISQSVSKTWQKIKEFFSSSGTTAEEVWESIKEGASNTWGKIKEFFTTVKSKALEIWGAVKEKVTEIWGKVVDFYERTKEKANEIWEKIRPYVLLIGGAFVGIYQMLKAKGEEIWGLITRIIDFLIDKGGKAIDWITNIDWKQWWEDLKKWCQDTWDSIKQFFEDLPTKADEAFQNLTGVDFETWLNNLSDKWEDLKDKVKECWEAVKKFFTEDLPQKMDEFAGKFGFESFSDMIDKIGESAQKNGKKLKWFFGIETPEWIDPKSGKTDKTRYDADNPELGPLPEEYDARYENGYLYWKDLIPDIEDITDRLKALNGVDFKTQVAVVLGIASLLGAMALVYLTISKLNDLQSNINNFSLTGLIYGSKDDPTGVGGFLDSAKGVVNKFQEVEKGTKWALMGAMFLEIGAAFAMMATIPWQNLILIAGIMGGFFLLIFTVFKYFDDFTNTNPESLLKVGEAFGAMASAFTLIGAAFWLMAKMDIPSMLVAAPLLLILFGALVSVLVLVDKLDVGNGQNLITFATAVGALSGAMLIIAAALTMLNGADPNSLIVSAIVMGALFAEIMGLLTYVGKSMSFDVSNVILFAVSVVAMSGALMVIALALKVLDGADPNSMIASAIALGALFAELAGVMIIVSLLGNVVNPASILAFAVSVVALSAAMVMIAGALLMLSAIPPDQVIQYAIALGVILGVMTILLMIAGAVPQLAAGMLLFATAILLLGTGAMLAGLGMLLMAQGLETLAGVGPDGINAIIDGLIRLAAVAPLLAIGFGAAVVIIATALGAAIVGFFTSIASSISENKETLQQGLTDFWLIIVESVINVLPKVRQAILMFLQMLIDITPKFFEWINTIIEGVTSTVFTAIGAFLDGLWDLFVRRLEWWRDNIGSIVHIIGEGVENFLLAFFDEIETRVPRIIDAGMDMFINLCNGISDAVDKHKEDLKNAINRVVESIKSLFCELFGIDQNKSGGASSIFSTYGGNLMQGLIDGINGMIEGVKSAISWVAETLKGTFTSDTEIKSPSKVFTRYGKYIDEGLAKGITRNTWRVEDASDNLAEVTVDGMSDTLTKISELFDEGLDSDPTITPVLDLSNVTEGISTMDEMLSSDRSINLAQGDNSAMNAAILRNNSWHMSMEEIRAALGKTNKGPRGFETQNNTFNITGNDPKAIANEVSTILQSQVERKDAVWA